MIRFGEKHETLLYWSAVFLVFLLILLRAFFIPFSHDESATFFFYVQSGKFIPYHSHLYTNNHFLNSALSWCFYQLAGSHRFVLRMPNILAFLVMAYGLFRLFRHLRYGSSRLLSCCLFIFMFNFLDFFELCRGYGLSMAFLILGLALMLDYFAKPSPLHLVWTVLCLHLALAANLGLISLVLLIWVILISFQYRNKRLALKSSVLLNVMSLLLMLFWLKYTFMLKESGKLDSGASDNYWNITFVSLIEMIFGSKVVWLQILLLGLFGLILWKTISSLWKLHRGQAALFQKSVLFTFLFCAMIMVIWLQRIVLDVNYPEDRTGLYLYILFAFALVFTLDNLPPTYGAILAPASLVVLAGMFVSRYNLQSFTHYFYHVLPRTFYDYLIDASSQKEEPFTIGGRFSREMNFAFMNYRGGAKLNPMDTPPQMRMNCDYNLAQEWESPYYRDYYEEVVRDRYWGHVLLKRRIPLSRELIFKKDSLPVYFNSSQEFVEFFRSKAPVFKNKSALEIELQCHFKKVPAPFNAFLVVSVESESVPELHYSRIALNWLDDDLSGETRRLKLCTGAIPEDFKSIVVYLWNINQQEAEFSLHALKLSELKGKGAGVEIPEAYYTKLYQLTKKPQL